MVHAVRKGLLAEKGDCSEPSSESREGREPAGGNLSIGSLVQEKHERAGLSRRQNSENLLPKSTDLPALSLAVLRLLVGLRSY